MGPLPVANPHNHPPSRTAQENINNTPVNTEVLLPMGNSPPPASLAASSGHRTVRHFFVCELRRRA